MKAIHVSNGIIPVPPGDIAASTEEHIFQLTQYLSRLGCEVRVIGIKGGEQQKRKRQQSTAKFHEVWWPPLPREYTSPFFHRFFSYILFMSQQFLFALFSIPSVARLLLKEKTDIVHLYNPNVALVYIVMRKLGQKGPLTVYCPFSPYGLTKFSWRNRLVYFPEVLSLKWADHIIASTPAVKKWLVSEFKLAPDKITQIYAGTDLDGVEEFLSHKKGTCHQSNMLLCTGKICQRKNQLTAVKAIAKVVAAHPEVKLVFTGPLAEANYLESIKEFIAENGLSANVEIKGEVSREELFNLYSDAVVFLFPTTAEIDPVSLKEALIFGLPVITSNIENIADIVNQEDGSAILVDPNDADGIAEAVLRLLDDSALRQSMSEKGKKVAKIMSYENVAKQTLALYERLVPDKKRA